MRVRAALSCGHRFRQCWQDVAINVFDGGTLGYVMHDVCAMRGTLAPGDVI